MKKQIAIMISVLFCVSSVYADGVGSLFQKALKAGRDNNGRGCYTIQVPSSKNILVEDALQYMRKNGYILTKDYGTKQMIRFGYYAKAIRTVEFIPENELESYIANMPQTNQSGKAVIFPNSRKETVDVYWSGSINNGSINGNGVGYTKLNNCVYVIKGRFENGMSVGSCEVVTATPVFANGRSPRFLQKIDKQNKNYTVGNSNNGYRSLYMNGKYGFINDRGDVIASCKYGNVVQEFNNAGYAIVTDPSDGDQEIKINTNGTKLGYSDRQLKINEEKRLAKEAEEKRLAEEKRRKELNERENNMYNDIVSKSQNMEDSYNKMSEYLGTFTNGTHYDEVLSLKNTLDVRLKEIENNKNTKKWSKGDKICYLDMNNGLVCGMLESLSGGKAKLKIISGHIYNNQNTMTIKGEPMYKDKEIWIGLKDGWHLATDGDFNELANNDNLMVGNSGGVNSPVASGKGGGKPSSFVDLGLPSGTLWAKWNVGASYPEEIGDSFTWGETKKPKSGKDVEYKRLGQLLEERDDAATANWGKNWRIPTKEELDELRMYCSFRWTDQGCYAVGPNGNSIFLPCGRYWSATYIPEWSLGWNPYKMAYEAEVFCGGRGRQFFFAGEKGNGGIPQTNYISSQLCVRPVLKYTKDEYMMMSIENQLGN